MTELHLRVPTHLGEAPLLLTLPPGPAERFRGTVLVYHGLHSNKEAQRNEYPSLAAEGFLTVGVDAPGHGARAGDGVAIHELLYVVRDAIDEVPAILDRLTDLLGERCGPFGMTGISMGAYITFGAASIEPRLQAVVPILGSPDWTRLDHGVADHVLEHSPHRRPQAFPPTALLAMNAGRDTNVPPAPARQFVDSLRPYYESMPQRLDYIEYPESAHFMREEDWNDLWSRTVAWMRRWL